MATCRPFEPLATLDTALDTGERQVLGPVTSPVLAKLLQRSGREAGVAVLVALALVDAQTHLPAEVIRTCP